MVVVVAGVASLQPRVVVARVGGHVLVPCHHGKHVPLVEFGVVGAVASPVVVLVVGVQEVAMLVMEHPALVVLEVVVVLLLVEVQLLEHGGSRVAVGAIQLVQVHWPSRMRGQQGRHRAE